MISIFFSIYDNEIDQSNKTKKTFRKFRETEFKVYTKEKINL